MADLAEKEGVFSLSGKYKENDSLTVKWIVLLITLCQNFTYSFGYLVKNDYNIANKLVKLNSDVHACFILQSCSQITRVYERKRVYERSDGISLSTTVNTGLKMYQIN